MVNLNHIPGRKGELRLKKAHEVQAFAKGGSSLRDLTEAFEWYQKQQAGLGVEFLNEIEGYCKRITGNPELYQSHRSQRIAVVRRFPYKIVYEIEAETIIVYAVYHDKRDPENLEGRK